MLLSALTQGIGCNAFPMRRLRLGLCEKGLAIALAAPASAPHVQRCRSGTAMERGNVPDAPAVERAEDQDLESMGSLLRCTSSVRGESLGSLRSRRSLDVRHGGIPRVPAPAAAPATPTARERALLGCCAGAGSPPAVMPTPKERNLLYCVAAAPATATPAQRAASSPFPDLTADSPFDRALSSGGSPTGLGAGAPSAFGARTRSGPAAAMLPKPSAAARRAWRGAAGGRTGLPVLALFVLLAAGLGLGIFVGQHIAGGGGVVYPSGFETYPGGYAPPARFAAGLVSAVGAGGAASVHRRGLAGGGGSPNPGGSAALERVSGGAHGLPLERGARPPHVSLEGEAGTGAAASAQAGPPARAGPAGVQLGTGPQQEAADSAPAAAAPEGDGRSAGSARPAAGEEEVRARGVGDGGSAFRRGAEAEAMRAAASQFADQRAGNDEDLLQQVRGPVHSVACVRRSCCRCSMCACGTS